MLLNTLTVIGSLVLVAAAAPTLSDIPPEPPQIPACQQRYIDVLNGPYDQEQAGWKTSLAALKASHAVLTANPPPFKYPDSTHTSSAALPKDAYVQGNAWINKILVHLSNTTATAPVSSFLQCWLGTVDSDMRNQVMLGFIASFADLENAIPNLAETQDAHHGDWVDDVDVILSQETKGPVTAIPGSMAAFLEGKPQPGAAPSACQAYYRSVASGRSTGPDALAALKAAVPILKANPKPFRFPTGVHRPVRPDQYQEGGAWMDKVLAQLSADPGAKPVGMFLRCWLASLGEKDAHHWAMLDFMASVDDLEGVIPSLTVGNWTQGVVQQFMKRREKGDSAELVQSVKGFLADGRSSKGQAHVKEKIFRVAEPPACQQHFRNVATGREPGSDDLAALKAAVPILVANPPPFTYPGLAHIPVPNAWYANGGRWLDTVVAKLSNNTSAAPVGEFLRCWLTGLGKEAHRGTMLDLVSVVGDLEVVVPGLTEGDWRERVKGVFAMKRGRGQEDAMQLLRSMAAFLKDDQKGGPRRLH
jgi:hypothetical protein